MREGPQQALPQGLGVSELSALAMRCSMKATPEDIRAGDILMFVNEEFVLDKDKCGPQALPPESASVTCAFRHHYLQGRSPSEFGKMRTSA